MDRCLMFNVHKIKYVKPNGHSHPPTLAVSSCPHKHDKSIKYGECYSTWLGQEVCAAKNVRVNNSIKYLFKKK